MNLGNVHVKLLLFLVIQQACTDCSPGTIYKAILWSMYTQSELCINIQPSLCWTEHNNIMTSTCFLETCTTYCIAYEIQLDILCILYKWYKHFTDNKTCIILNQNANSSQFIFFLWPTQSISKTVELEYYGRAKNNIN